MKKNLKKGSLEGNIDINPFIYSELAKPSLCVVGSLILKNKTESVMEVTLNLHVYLQILLWPVRLKLNKSGSIQSVIFCFYRFQVTG